MVSHGAVEPLLDVVPERTDSAPGRPDRSDSVLRRRRKLLIPLAGLWVVAAALALALVTADREASIPLGANADVAGGVVRVSAVIPLESDGWQPLQSTTALRAPVQDGAHRVRIILDLTALDATGLAFRAADYSIVGLGLIGRPDALWSAPTTQAVAPGESLQPTLVFEIPDTASALVLEGPDAARLSLGTAHHSGGL